MALEAIWLAPPLILNGGGNLIYILWSFPSLEAFWSARFVEAEAKSAWWASTANMVRDRRRTILTDFTRASDVRAFVPD